jgi:hypothetical protein
MIIVAVVVGLMVACTCVPSVPGTGGKPTVTIITPADGAEFQVGQDIAVQVIATDSQGVRRVELSAGGGLVDTTSSPSPQPSFSATLHWAPNMAGTQVLTVRAYNASDVASDPAIIRVNVTSGSATGTTPSINIFVAEPPAITAGGSSTLRWEVSGATSVEIDHGIGGVSLSGTRSVSPASTTTYKLTAHGTGGDATATVQVTVNPSGPSGTIPTINTFWADPPAITAGGSSTLRWEVSGATSVEIDHGIGGVALSGSRSVNPASTTTYLLTAHGTGGNATATAVVTVNPAPVSINATITYHSYDATSGWVTFQVVNTGGVALESARTQIVNRSTSANYYGPATSDSPFRDNPTSDVLVDSVAPGATKYMRYKLTGNPTGVPCRATITIYAGEGSSGASVTRTVDFDLPGAASINATITYHSYDAATGWVTFQIINNAGGATLECVKGEIKNSTTNAYYYSPGYSDSPFRTSATQESAGDPSMSAGQTRYLRFKLTGNPTGVPCKATITLYTGNAQTGASSVKEINFDLPGAVGINATITYHSYDAATGWVTFRVVNNAGGATLESARAQIVNRNTNANYYGPGTSDSPFRSNPTSDVLVDSVAPGTTAYMRYKLTGNPTGVPCQATITLYSGEGSTGASSVKEINFDLPGGINATVTYHSYDAATGWVTFRIVNNAGGATLECVKGEVKNRNTNAYYYSPGYSDSPFRTSATQTSAGDSSMSAGQTRYLRFKLTGNPTGVPCRATLTLYTGNGQTGASSVKTIDFNLP